MTYLDTNATAPIKPAVRAAMVEALDHVGNASSVHRYGSAARRSLEEAREEVATMVGVRPAQVVFTSGGSEANNLILSPVSTVIASAVEHDSVLAFSARDCRLPVLGTGVVDLSAAEDLLRRAASGTVVSVMLVNNETGVIQPVSALAGLAKKFGHKMHVDAVQACGRLPLDFMALGVDAMTLSAHKIGGPQGVGALVVAEKLSLQPLIKGGGQERNRRAGTENVAGIVGCGVAARLAANDVLAIPRLRSLRDGLQERMRQVGGEDVVFPGAEAMRVGNTLSVAMRGVSSETQVAAMDLAGVAVSAGSACSSGKVKASHVLSAMGYGPDIAGCALRVSLGWHTKEEDIDHCFEAWAALFRRTRSLRHTAAA